MTMTKLMKMMMKMVRMSIGGEDGHVANILKALIMVAMMMMATLTDRSTIINPPGSLTLKQIT